MTHIAIDESDVYFMLPIVEAFIRGYCFFRLVKPFMISEIMPQTTGDIESVDAYSLTKKKRLFWVGGAYFFIMLLLYIIPLQMKVLTAYGIGSLIMFFAICLADRRNYRQKAFLVVVFFSLNWLSAAIAEILYDNFYSFAENTRYMKCHPEMYLPLYAGLCICYMALEFILTCAGIWQILRVYKNKGEDMENKELVMLSLPSFIGIMAYDIMQNYRIFYILKVGKNKDSYDSFSLLFYGASVIMIVVVVVLYQDIRAKQEENQQTELLAMQVESIRHHMEQVESLYQNIRSIRHDMTNHILTLERLYEEHDGEEAKIYGRRLQAELIQMTGGAESGNPVTDVILREFDKKARKQGVSFRSEFHYPVNCDMDVFDISVILNNALQNAIENTGKGEEKQISVVSYRRNNAYIIEICNSFSGTIQWNAESRLPVTSKEKKDGHGYGLANIRRVAGKYAGDIDIALKKGEFCLCIMLMIE